MPLLGILGTLVMLLALVSYQPPPFKTLIEFYFSNQPSGIEGLVVIDSRCPPGMEVASQCQPTPSKGRVAVHRGNRDGEVIADIAVGADGRFRVELPPGNYSVELTGSLPPGALYGSWDHVTVKPHAFTDVTLRWDNGFQ